MVTTSSIMQMNYTDCISVRADFTSGETIRALCKEKHISLDLTYEVSAGPTQDVGIRIIVPNHNVEMLNKIITAMMRTMATITGKINDKINVDKLCDIIKVCSSMYVKRVKGDESEAGN